MTTTLFTLPTNSKKCGTCIHFLPGVIGQPSICIVKTDAERTLRKGENYQGFVYRSEKDTACPSYAKTK